MLRRVPILLCALLLAMGAVPNAGARVTHQAASLVDTLAFSGFVVDQAHILDPAARARLTAKLDRFQQTSGHQFAVVTVDALDGLDITQFTKRLANRWGVGRRGLNDGIVLLVAPHQRQVRLAPGRGLEAVLTDARCQAIIDRAMLPAFRKGDGSGAIEAGVAGVIRTLQR